MQGTKHIRILLLVGFVFANMGVVEAQTKASEKVEGESYRSSQPAQRIASGEENSQTEVRPQTTTVHRDYALTPSEQASPNEKPQRIGAEEKNKSTQINSGKKPGMKHYTVTGAPSSVMSTESPKRIDEKQLEENR